MKNEKYIQSLNKIEPDQAAQARMLRQIRERTTPRQDQARKGNNMNKTMKWLAPAAACLVLAVAAVSVVRSGLLQKPPIATEPAKNSHALQVPAMELPKNTDDTIAMDMIGLFIYQGRIYTQTSWYYDDAAVRALVGEKLGTATGGIDEWSSQDAYATELAGTIAGDVYSVKGYDPQFRLCMQGSYENEDGSETQYVNFYENLNGIGLTTGADVFEERLQLRARWESVQYQTHLDWDYTQNAYHDLQASDEEIAAFLNALAAGKFEYVHSENGDFYDAARAQTHLYFHQSDGTVVELRLFEDGYVGYQHLGWYFVKMPGAAFDAVFASCTE